VEKAVDDPVDWLAVLDAHAVTHAVVMPEIALMDPGKAVEDHDHLFTACAKSHGRMIPVCSGYLPFREEGLAELERCLKLGFRGMKFHPWLQGMSVSLPAMDEACEMAAAYGVPVLFHDGTPPFSLPSQLALLAQRHPRTQIVLGHSGLFEHWREAAVSMRSADNLWACLCGPYPAGKRFLLQECDRSRLLWGSDFGYGLADCYTYRLPIMEHIGLTEEDRQAIFVENPRRLLRV
jgi:predicted TIM-barrel fold metal-dependent hydrolase